MLFLAAETVDEGDMGFPKFEKLLVTFGEDTGLLKVLLTEERGQAKNTLRGTIGCLN